jgi:hypothetical protein
MSRSEHYTVVIRGGQESPNILSGNETEAKYFINWATVIPKKHKKFTLYSYFRTTSLATTDVVPYSMIFVECDAFQKVGQFDNKTNGQSSLIAIAPSHQTYHQTNETSQVTGTIDPSTGELTTVEADNGASTLVHNESKSIPITVTYPHQDIFNVKLTDIKGSVLDSDEFDGLFFSWVLVLDLVPIE